MATSFFNAEFFGGAFFTGGAQPVPAIRVGGGGSAKIISRAREELERLLYSYDENLLFVDRAVAVAAREAVVEKVERVAKEAKAIRLDVRAPVIERINWKKIELDQDALQKIEVIIARYMQELEDEEVLLLM